MRPFGKVIAFAFSLVALPVAADVVYYDLTIRGFKVAELEVAAQETRRNYSVAGTINNTGLTRIVRKLNYSGTTRGTIKNRRLVPQTYSEQANTAGYDTAVSIGFQNGTPTQVNYVSNRGREPDAPDPATLNGAVDPLTAIYGVLRDTPAQHACDYDVTIYDGGRESRLILQPNGRADGLPTCKGRYIRVRGYTADEVARHKQFDLLMWNRDLGDGMLAADTVEFDTIYGKARVVRR